MSPKKLVPILLLSVLPSVALTQSLQQAADKEKSRRQKLPGSQRVFTDEDLTKVHAEAPPQEPGPEEPPAQGVGGGAPTQQEGSSEATPSSREAAKAQAELRAQEKEAEWNGIRQSYQARFDAALSDLARIRAAQAECLKNAQYIMAYPAMDDCSGFPPQVKAKQAELKKIEDDLADDARRRGVLPGKARIQK